MSANARPRPLRAALSVFRIQLLAGMQYRISELSGSVVSIVYVLIEIAVYTVFYLHGDNSAQAGGLALTLPQMVSYMWIGQFVFTMQMNSVNGGIMEQIRTGDIGLELCRPFPLYSHWFAKQMGTSLTPLVLRGLPVLLAGVLMPAAFRLGAPDSVPALLCALTSLLCSLILCTSFVTLALALRVNVAWGDGPMNMLFLLTSILSGAFLPLQLWPDALQKFLLYQPFAGYLDIPIRLYLGTLPAAEAPFFWLLQLAWSSVFIAMGCLIMRRRLRTIVVQGG